MEPWAGLVETAEAGSSLQIVGRGFIDEIPGPHYVAPGLGEDLLSFHELERQGLTYRRHHSNCDLREWTREGEVVPELTYKVYPGVSIGVLHPDGAKHAYPEEVPLGAAARAYRLVVREPVVSVRDLEERLPWVPMQSARVALSRRVTFAEGAKEPRSRLE